MDAVEDVKSRLSIEDVVSQYVQLKRSGRNFKGLSPFTSEKTPSFMVSPEKQIWHDFSSGKGGNMFSFVMEMEGLDFRAALEQLARQAGVDLAQYQTKKQGTFTRERERLFAAVEMAAKFYQLQLSKNTAALEYVRKQRALSKETIINFRLGYAPDTPNSLTQLLRKKGFSEQELKRAGLSTARYKGLGDMFRGRLMIPLQDQSGKVIGFTARLLKDQSGAPKYINTPATPLYDKSRHVYGLHLAKEAIRKQKYAVMVEGNMDVIASHQAGVTNVVATAGTALTEMQLKTLSRLSPDVRLAFDQDAAGIAATERAIPLASKVGINLSMIDIPSGKDPDELIRDDPKKWQAGVEKHEYAIDWLIDRYEQLIDTSSALGKRQFTDKILVVVRTIVDNVEQDHYILQLSERLGISADALRAKLHTLKSDQQAPRKRAVNIQQQVDPLTVESLKTQHNLLALVFFLPSLREFIAPLTVEMFTEENAQHVLRYLQSHSDADKAEVPSLGKKQSGLLQGTDDFVKMLRLLYEELYHDQAVLELRDEASRLQARLVQQYVKTEKSKLAKEMQAADETKTEELLEQAKKLDVLLKRTKEN